MTREEQIAEMVPYMCYCCEIEEGFGKCIDMVVEKCKIAREAAEALYNAGYRKAEEVRRETVKEILIILNELGGCGATADYIKGWDDAIGVAYRYISIKYGVEIE